MRRLALGAPLLALACGGVSENDFIVAYEVAYCEAYELCATPEMLRNVGQRECLVWYRDQRYPEPPECPYERDAAEVCLTDLATAGCEGVNPALPASCREVYTQCRLPLLPDVELGEG